METAISTFCKYLASFCNDVQSSSQALSESIQRRPIHLDSAASSFVQTLNRRITSTSADLNLLECMAFGTVSVEELLGHCNEVYKTNHKYISLIEDRMIDSGYVPELEIGEEHDEDLEIDLKDLSSKNGISSPCGACGSVSDARWRMKRSSVDSLLEDISLQNLGLSDACLATLASQDNEAISMQNVSSLADNQTHGKMLQHEPSKDAFNSLDTDFGSATDSMIEASKDDYDNLPSYMKSLASWEELQEAVVKMNFYLCKKAGAKGSNSLNQNDLEELELGCKGKSYLLLLIRMNQLVVETIDGSISYRVHA